jgi:hypothetical protein
LADERCFDRIYADAAESSDVAATLAALQSLAARGDLDDCHLQAHRLAHAAYRVVGDVGRAFLLGGRQCRLGYLHGAVEASGAETVVGAHTTHGVALPLCDRFPMQAERSACAHGLGHALMLRTGHDLLASVEGCEAAARKGLARVPCERGVMMQNSLRYAERADFTVASLRGCETVEREQRLRRLCLENVGVVAALSLGHDVSRASATCRRLTRTPERSICLAGAHGEIREARGSN